MRSLALTVLTISLSLHTVPTLAALQTKVVALSGEIAAGSNGATFSTFGDPIINTHGDVAFNATLVGSGVDSSNDDGLWSRVLGSIDILAREGEQATGTQAGVYYDAIGTPAIGGDGLTVFKAELAGTGVTTSNDDGIWAGKNAEVTKLAQAGEVADGTNTELTYTGFRFAQPSINATGVIAFRSDVLGTPNSTGAGRAIFTLDQGTQSLIVQSGDDANVSPPGAEHNDFNNPAISAAGTIVFQGGLTSTPLRGGVWSASASRPDIIAREGDTLNGSTGLKFQNFNLPVVNQNDSIAFVGSLDDGNSQDLRKGVFLYQSGSLSTVVLEGENTIGITGSSFSDFGNPSLSNSDEVAFTASYSAGNATETGIWAGTKDALRLITAEGELAPGTEHLVGPNAQVTLQQFFGFSSVTINDDGLIAFSATLNDPMNKLNRGIWVATRTGQLIPIAVTQDTFNVNGDVKTIGGVSLLNSAVEGYRASSLNDEGVLVYRLVFSDGTSGVFTTTVPEPGTLMILVVGSAILIGQRDLILR